MMPTDRKTDPQVIKVPMALVAPLWAILLSVGGFAWNWKTEQILMRKDMVTVTNSVKRVETKIATLSATAYPRTEADRDQKIVSLQFENLRYSLASIEKKQTGLRR